MSVGSPMAAAPWDGRHAPKLRGSLPRLEMCLQRNFPLCIPLSMVWLVSLPSFLLASLHLHNAALTLGR